MSPAAWLAPLLAGFWLGWMSSAAAGEIRFRAEATIDHADVRLSDIADLSDFSPQQKAALSSLEVLRLKNRAGVIVLNTTWLAERARGQIPQLSAAAFQAVTGKVRVTYDVKAPSSAGLAQCMRTTKALRSGDAITVRDVETVACSAHPREDLVRYDRIERVARARDDISAGSVLMAVPAATLAGARRGDDLIAEVRVGHVVVTRQVVAVQDAAVGTHIFVSTSTGDLLSAAQARTN